MNALDALIELLAVGAEGGQLSAETTAFLADAASRHVILGEPIHVALGLSAHGGAGTRRQILLRIRDLKLRAAAALVHASTPYARSQALHRALSRFRQGRGRVWLQNGPPGACGPLDRAMFEVVDWCHDHDLRLPGLRALHDILQVESHSNCTEAASCFEQTAEIAELLGTADATAPPREAA